MEEFDVILSGEQLLVVSLTDLHLLHNAIQEVAFLDARVHRQLFLRLDLATMI